MRTEKEIEDKFNELQEKLNSNFNLYSGLITTISTLKWILDK